MYPLVYFSLGNHQYIGRGIRVGGATLDSRIAWSSSSTHDAARPASSALALVEAIFESILEEMSREAALRGK